MNIKKIGVISVAIILAAIALWSNINMKKDASYVQEKEAVICGSTLDPTCYRYRCTSSFLILPPPPGGTGICTDGTLAEKLEEVKR